MSLGNPDMPWYVVVDERVGGVSYGGPEDRVYIMTTDPAVARHVAKEQNANTCPTCHHSEPTEDYVAYKLEPM